MVLNAAERRERNRLAAQRSRARESPEARAERLWKQRERSRKTRALETTATRAERVRHDRERHQRVPAPPAPQQQAAPNATIHDEPQRAWGNGGISRLRPVSAASKSYSLRRLRLSLGAAGLDEVACAVCDRNELRARCRVVAVSDGESMHRLREVLSSSGEELPDELVAEYDCSGVSSALEGALLSKRGVRADGDLHICDECDESLAKGSIPKFSIKNGFYVGTLPSQFTDMTLPERLMTPMESVVAATRVMRGGAHRSIRSHCLVFDATPGPAATLLPIPVDGIISYRVVLAGPFTTEQQAHLRQMHRVRRQVVEDVLTFYREHNVLYESVAVNYSELLDETIAENLIFQEADAELEVSEMEAEQDHVGGVATTKLFPRLMSLSDELFSSPTIVR
jgi:hypothetical protein